MALPLAAGAFPGQNFVTYLQAGDFTETTANTAQVIELFDVIAGDMITGMASYLETPLADASDAAFNSCTLSLGDGADADRYLGAVETNVNGTEIIFAATTGTTAVDAVTADKVPYAYNAADTVDATIGSMASKSLSNIDTGKVWIVFGKANLKNIADLSS